MAEEVPIHVVAPPGPDRERITTALAEHAPVVHETVQEFRTEAEEGRRALVVDVDDGGPLESVLDLCREIADRDREWLVVLAEEGEDGISFRPLASGFALAPERLGDALARRGDDWPASDLHEVLRFIARIRHDINNPLTAGMAEAQLLLMDVGSDAEVRESLETIQRQLQRIQALVRDLTRLRRPAPEMD